MRINKKSKDALAKAKADLASKKTTAKAVVTATATKAVVKNEVASKATKAVKKTVQTVAVTQLMADGIIKVAYDGITKTLENGSLTGAIRCDGRIELGAYVNDGRFGKGRNGDAKVALMEGKEFAAKLKACEFSYNKAGGKHLGLALGDAAQKGCLALVSFATKAKRLFVWHIEQDSNYANSGVRGGIEYVAKETIEHKAIRSALCKATSATIKVAVLTGSRGVVARLVKVGSIEV